MFRKTLVSLVIAAVLLVTMAAAVSAQSDSTDAEVVQPSIEPAGGAIIQSIPLTLTVNVPGPDGMITVDVPVLISLDIKVSMSNDLTAEVSVKSELEAVASDEEPAPEEAVTEESKSEEAVSEEAVEEPAVEEPTKDAADEPAEEEMADESAAEEPAAEEAATEEPAAEEAATEEPESEEAATGEAVEEPTTKEPTEKVAPTPVPVGRKSADTEEAAEVDETAEGEKAATTEEEPVVEVVDTNCTDPRSVIYTPEAGDTISGTLEVYGNATHEMFRYYKLEYTSVDTEGDEYAFIIDSKNAVRDGLLAVLDTNTLINGDYILRLTVVDATGNFPPQCSVPITIAN